MWNQIAVLAAPLLIMLLIGIVTLVFTLPDAISKYISRKAQPLDATRSAPNSDEAAAQILGESLRHAKASAETTVQLLAAFWAASAENRRVLAHLVAGLSAQGRAEDETLQAILRSLPDTSGPP